MTAGPPPATSGPSARQQDGGESMRRVARGSVANLAGAAVTGVCTFALTVVIARGVAKHDAGVFFAVTSLFLIATTIGNLGTQTGLVYFLSRCRTRGRTGEIDSYVRTAVWPMVVLALAMAAGTFLLAPELARLISAGDAHRATVYLRCIAWFIPLAGIEIVLLAGTRGLGAIRPYALIEQIYRPMLQLALVLLVTVAFSASLLGLAWALAYAPAAVAAVVSWRRVRARFSPPSSAHERHPVTAEFWRFTLPRSLTSTIQMLMQRFDVVLVAALASPVDAAIYAAATRFIVLGQLGINALTIAAQPRFAETLSTDDHRPANELYHVTTSWLMILTWPVYLLLLVFAAPILTVFGRGYPAGATSIAIIAASMLIATGSGMVDTVLAMAGRTLWNLLNAVLALAVNLGLDFALIPPHGILGAAIGWAAAILVRNLAALAQVRRSLRFTVLARQTAVAAGLTVACYGIVPLVARIAFGNTVPVMLTSAVIATGCYVGGLVGLREPLRLASLLDIRRGRRAAAHGIPG